MAPSRRFAVRRPHGAGRGEGQPAGAGGAFGRSARARPGRRSRTARRWSRRATRGAGRVVLFHVTANADWSNLPLSGLFVDMLRRLVQLSAGVAERGGTAALAPAETLDGFGAAVAAAAGGHRRWPPTRSARRRCRRAIRRACMDRRAGGRRSTSVPALPPLSRRRRSPGATVETLPVRSAGTRARAVAAGCRDRAAGARSADLAGTARSAAAPGAGAARALALLLLAPRRRRHAWKPGPSPALGDPARLHRHGRRAGRRGSRAGLEGLSDYVNRRTAATLSEPDAVTPGQDRPQLLPAALLADHRRMRSRSRRDAAAALNDYMGRGGIILIDTRDGGSGEGFAPGTESAAARRPGPGRPAARTAHDRACAGARILPAAGLPGPLHRRHGLGAARPGPRQRQRQPGHHRRQRLGRGLGDGCRRDATRTR